MEIIKVNLFYDEILWEEVENKDLIKYYFSTYESYSNSKIEENFFLRNINMSDIIYKKYNKKKSINLGNRFTFYEYTPKVIDERKIETKKISLYKIEFMFDFIEKIITQLIYQRLTKDIKYLKQMVDNGTIGYLLEIIIVYNILGNKILFDEKIKIIESMESLVPNQFSIKYFSSSRFKDVKKEFVSINYKEIFDLKQKIKKQLKDEVTFIKQELFYRRYYDCGLLLPVKGKPKHFILTVFQISIDKPPKYYLSKEEHELVLYHVKRNIENEYDIILDSSYFEYILGKINGKVIDKTTEKKYINQHQIFDIDNLLFIKKNNLNDNNSLISDKFVFHNEKSLLKDYEKINEIVFLKDISKLFRTNKKEFIPLIEKDNNDLIFELIKKNLENLNPKIELDKNQFFYIGTFKSITLLKCLTFFSFVILNDNNILYLYFDNIWRDINGKNIDKLGLKKQTFSFYCSLYPIKKKQ